MSARSPEDRQRRILESISDACLLLDEDWVCTYSNGVAHRMLGVDVDELEGRCLWDALPGLQGTGLEEQLRRCVRTGQAARFEAYFAARDAFAAAHCYPTEDGLTLFLTDLSESRRNERLLKHTEERFEALADVVPVLLFSSDAAGVVDYVNHRFSSYAGKAANELLGTGWKEVIEPEDLPGFELEWQRARRRGEVLRRQCRLRSQNGSHRWFVLRARPMQDAEGEVTRWFGCFTDIHQEKVLELELEEAGRHKDQFLSMLAHELRNPLAPIRSAARVLDQAAPDDPRRAEMLEIIQRQVQHMARLLEDLLDVSRIERGKIRLEPRSLDLRATLDELTRDLDPVAAAARLRLRRTLPAAEVWMQADPARLTQALGNVLHNSIKFTPPGGWIEVDLETEGEFAEIRVRDSGVGMDARTLRRVFEPFHQADQALDRGRGGLGLGLALVRGFVRMHGGEVQLHSEGEGQGTEVRLRFPLTPRS